MLLFGYLGEINVINKYLSVILGFIPFFMYYKIIYDNYAIHTKQGKLLYFYFLFIWFLYGVAAFMSYYTKNIMYNILDLFAKNFFGIFLSYIVFSKKL